jgi:hypothetical protein
MSTSANDLLFLSPQRWQMRPTVCSAVNSCSIDYLRELQKTCRREVDFGRHNVKWYETVNFDTIVVVLCYYNLICSFSTSICRILSLLVVTLRCIITGNGEAGYIFLGRPWGPFGRVVFAHTFMDRCIKPTGWHNWDKSENERTACFYEYRYWIHQN